MTPTQAATSRVFGSGIRRREDPRLLTGTARYTADFTLPHAACGGLRSARHASSRLKPPAQELTGVVALLRRPRRKRLEVHPFEWLLPNAGLNMRPTTPWTTDVVRYLVTQCRLVANRSIRRTTDTRPDRVTTNRCQRW